MRKSIYTVIALALSFAAAHAAPRAFDVDDIARLRDVSDPHVSPDGAWVVYAVRSIDTKKDKHETHIWMTSFDGKTTVPLTARAGESESDPRFSPDGRYVSFLSGRSDDDENDQVWLLDRAGGEARKLTDFKGGVADYAWSPDGKRLALIVADTDKDAPSGDDKEKKTPKPIVVDRFAFMLDKDGYQTTLRDHLFVFDVASGKADQLVSGDYYETMPSWSPDSSRIAFVSKRHAEFDRDDNWDIFVIDAHKGAAPRPLTTNPGADNPPDDGLSGSPPVWSPDGKWIAYRLGGDPKLIEYATKHLAVIPSDGGAPRVLTAALDRNVDAPQWSADGKSLLFLVEDDRTSWLGSIAATGGAITRVAGARDAIDAFDTAQGHTALALSNPLAPTEIYAFDGKPTRQLSHQNDFLKDVRLATTAETSFKSKDGTEVHGFAMLPPGGGTTRLPTILRIHGGPQSQFALDFNPEWQILAGHGYAVIAANPRGSTGRGEKYAAGIYAAWGSVDVQDELACADDAVARGVADPARLGIGGWSYGGMLTNYVIASDTRFKAATSGASIANILAGYGSDEYAHDYETELGLPWKATAVWERISYPFLHADRIVTPTLFLGGDKDMNVPLHNGEQMYQALRSMGVDTRLIIYPGQYHGLTVPSYLRDREQRYLDWYDAHLKT
jgi:dipeptidyl aminopeptidase/acylaminoacyl peptidase